MVELKRDAPDWSVDLLENVLINLELAYIRGYEAGLTKKTSKQRRRIKRGELSAAVTSVILELDGEFSFHEIRQGLKNKFLSIHHSVENDSSLTHVLTRLESKGLIKMVSRGHGKRPSFYSYTEADEGGE